MAVTQKYEVIISMISRMTKLIVSISVNPFDNYIHATHAKVLYVLQDKPPLFPGIRKIFENEEEIILDVIKGFLVNGISKNPFFITKIGLDLVPSDAAEQGRIWLREKGLTPTIKVIMKLKWFQQICMEIYHMLVQHQI